MATAPIEHDIHLVARQNILEVVSVVLIRIYEASRESLFGDPVAVGPILHKMGVDPKGLGQKITTYLQDKGHIVYSPHAGTADITVEGMIEVQKHLSFGHAERWRRK